MKKFFVLTLITFAFVLTQLALPLKAVTVDNDVGICYVAPMDQVTVDMVYVADYTISTYPDYRSSVLAVEKADYMITLNSTIGYRDLYVNDIYNGTPANQMTTKLSKANRAWGLRLDIGEQFSRVGVTARHT